jgi:hypothetical protein
MRTTHWTRLLSGAVMLWSSGVGAEPPPTNSAQGTQLHGTGRFESINIPYASVEPSAPPAGVTCPQSAAGTVGNGRLVAAQSCSGGNPPVTVRYLEGPALAGSVFRAPFEGRSVKLSIEEVRCHEDITPPSYDCTQDNVNAGKARWEYRVTASTDDKAPEPLCPHGSGFALAVPNAWSAGGDLLSNPEYFTFACAPKNQGTPSQPFFVGGGVIAKCIDWGYPPWATAEYAESQARDYHQLCTRMAMADYCGEGRANTLDGTPLRFMGISHALSISTAGRMPATLAPEGYALEAVWRLSDCGDVRPICLGKQRWDTLSLEATCVSRRLVIESSIRPCEGLSLSGMANQTVLVSYSLFIDKPLVMFKASDTSFVTTALSVVDALGPNTTNLSAHKPDLNGDGLGDSSSFAALRNEGPLLSPKLPENIRKRMGAFIKPLYRCANVGGRWLLTDSSTCDGAAGFYVRAVNGDQGVEGFIYSSVDSASEGQRRPLKLWRHASIIGVYATSTVAPAGFVLVKELGFLPAVGQLPGRDL